MSIKFFEEFLEVKISGITTSQVSDKYIFGSNIVENQIKNLIKPFGFITLRELNNLKIIESRKIVEKINNIFKRYRFKIIKF